jgi:hypothetical protein
MYRLEKPPRNWEETKGKNKVAPHYDFVSSWREHRDPIRVIEDVANGLAPHLAASDPTIPEKTLSELVSILEQWTIIVREAYDELQARDPSNDDFDPLAPVAVSADCG